MIWSTNTLLVLGDCLTTGRSRQPVASAATAPAAARLARPARTSRAAAPGLDAVVERFNIIERTPWMSAAPGLIEAGDVRGTLRFAGRTGSWPARNPRARRPKGRFLHGKLSILATMPAKHS